MSERQKNRNDQILKLLLQEGSVSVEELMASSGASAPSIRRDLTRLEARGLIRRTRGGAALVQELLYEPFRYDTAFQTREVVDAMRKDSGIELDVLRTDGGMVNNELLMQFQADVLDAPVVRPVVAETTCLGAAYAAGLAVGYWPDTESLRANWKKSAEWTPAMAAPAREASYRRWKKAVQRTLDWVDDDDA